MPLGIGGLNWPFVYEKPSYGSQIYGWNVENKIADYAGDWMNKQRAKMKPGMSSGAYFGSMQMKPPIITLPKALTPPSMKSPEIKSKILIEKTLKKKTIKEQKTPTVIKPRPKAKKQIIKTKKPTPKREKKSSFKKMIGTIGRKPKL